MDNNKPSSDEKINFIKECKWHTDSNDNYSVGLFNGLELALSIIEGREAIYKACTEEENVKAIEHDTLVDCLLSCFSNDDLMKHVELRKQMQSVGIKDDCNKDTCSNCDDKCENGMDENKSNKYFG